MKFPTADQSLEELSVARLAWLCGEAEEEALEPPEGLIRRLRQLDQELHRELSRQGVPEPPHWGELITARAGLRGFSRHGRLSANRACHLVESPLGLVSINMARASDLDLLATALGISGSFTEAEIVDRVATNLSVTALGMAWEMGVAISRFGEMLNKRPSTVVTPRGEPGEARDLTGAIVLDLSALWAGPLATHLMARAGAEVIKVEDVQRPDGARQDSPFYQWLHAADQHNCVLDFSRESDRKELRRLIEQADVVVEASRPRALRHLGCAPEQATPRRGQVWLSLTGYGRSDAVAHRVAFGDDAGIAAGLSVIGEEGQRLFVGDAIADPMAGMLGALATMRALRRGGAVLIDLALSAVGGGSLSGQPSAPASSAVAPVGPTRG